MAYKLGAVVVALIVLLVVIVVGLACVAAVGWLLMRRRRSRVDPAAREAMLDRVGYARAGAAWTRTLDDNAVIVFEEGPGWKWTVRLPRYNTMSLTVRERSAAEPLSGAFEAGIADLDQRFVFASPLAAQTVGLVGNGSVANALLGVPWLSMSLGADELVVEDPALAGLERVTGSTAVGGAAALRAEEEIHQAVAVVVSTVFRVLYSRFTGTIMDEFR
ncbi:MAG: hypothetical protein R3F59_12445 [Myxococcota bacterium]